MCDSLTRLVSFYTWGFIHFKTKKVTKDKGKILFEVYNVKSSIMAERTVRNFVTKLLYTVYEA